MRVTKKEFSAFGTLAELYLLTGFCRKENMLKDAEDALQELKTRAKDAQYAINSTRDQIAHHTEWWTRDNGFFPNQEKANP